MIGDYIKERKAIGELKKEERRNQARETAKYKIQLKAEQKRERYLAAVDRQKVVGKRKREFIQKGGTVGVVGRGLVSGLSYVGKELSKPPKKGGKPYKMPDFRF